MLFQQHQVHAFQMVRYWYLYQNASRTELFPVEYARTVLMILQSLYLGPTASRKRKQSPMYPIDPSPLPVAKTHDRPSSASIMIEIPPWGLYKETLCTLQVHRLQTALCFLRVSCSTSSSLTLVLLTLFGSNHDLNLTLPIFVPAR